MKHGVPSNDKSSHTPPTESTGALLLAASYLRVSTKEQAERDGDPEGYSIPAQREANRRKADSLGAVIAVEFVDRGESARSAARPQLQAMLRYLAEHPEIKYVIVHKVDRLARNRMDDVEINLALQKTGVTLVSATENIDETPSGMLLHGIMSSIAEFYSRNLSTEVVKGMSQKVKTGGTPGKPPLGYRNVGAINSEGREVRTIDLDPERAELIRWAFRAYATGEWSLTALTAELELRGLTNLPTPKFPLRPIRSNHLYLILTHPYYKGEVVWRGARYPGRHPKLVDEATWRRVQDVLTARGPGEKQREHQHYLKSSVFCGGCGTRLIITNATNRHGAIYPYFICVGRHQKRTPCTRKALLISVVEALITDYYASVELDTELRQHIEAALTEELQSARSQAEALHRELNNQRQQLTHERTRLLQAHYAGAVPLELLKTEQDRITGQLEIIESRLEATSAHFDTVQDNLKLALDLAGNCHRAYLQADDRTRRLLNQALFEMIYIDEDGVRAALAEPFKTLLGPDVMEAAGRGHRSRTAAATTVQAPTKGPKNQSDVRHDWSAAYIRRIRAQRPKTNEPASVQHGAGLKEVTLVHQSDVFQTRTVGGHEQSIAAGLPSHLAQSACLVHAEHTAGCSAGRYLSGRLRFVAELMFNACMEIATLGTGLALGNSAVEALDRGATGVRAAVRRLRLAGYVDIEWLDLGDGLMLTAAQVSDLARCLKSDTVRPLLSMAAFALATRSPDLRRTLKENFTSEAKRWQIDHKANWHNKAAGIWSRIEEIYSGIIGPVTATEEVADELRIYTAFLATPVSDALEDENSASDFASRLASLAADVERMSVVSRTTAKTIEQIRVAVQTQPISALSQSDKFADFHDLYVDRNFVDSEGTTSISSAEFTLSGQPFRAVLMGSPGAGKSTFVKHLVRSSSDEHRDLQIPALELRCREYARNGWSKSVTDHLLQTLTVDLALDVDAQALSDLLLLGRAIVVFDGLDEVTNQTQRIQMVQRIHAFAGRYPAVSLLVTSREVGYERAPVSRSLFDHLRLEEFSEAQIEEYTHRWFNSVDRMDLRDDFMSDSESIADIRRNPLLLSLLCMLYRERGAIPLNRRAIYSQCANELFHRWDTHRQILQLESMPKYGDRLMQEIARWFYTTPSTGGGLDEQILTKVISNFMRDTLGFDATDAERDARDFLDFCANRLWLLAKVGTGHRGVRIFNFTHRTFYEYFAADSLARAGSDDDIAGKIVESFQTDATSVLPELLIQAYDEYRERGAAKVYDLLCARRTQVTLLLRLMEGVNLPAFARKAAFDLILSAYASGSLSTDACRALFALTSSARKHYVEQYVMPADQPIGRMLLLDAWASFQLSGRWTGRAVKDWLPLIDEVLDKYLEPERDEWTSAAVANWLVIRGKADRTTVVLPWQYLACETLAGWVPGVAWWVLDAMFATGQSLPDDSRIGRICQLLVDDIASGALLPSVLHRLDEALSSLAIDQLPWNLRIAEDGAFVKTARSLLVMVALASAEAGFPHLAVTFRNAGALALDELLLERLRRSRGYRGNLSVRASEVLTALPPECREWAMSQRDFCRAE